MLNGLDLFSGIGGITYALQDWVRPVAYCEIEPFCQSVLMQRMQEGDLPKAPIWDDITTLSSRRFPDEFIKGNIDIIYGGFPCQDISVAGAGKGLEGERSGLFFEIMRLAKEIKPKFLFLENVPAITHRGGIRVVREIAALGYDCRWCVISASGVGALHRRERWFLLAHSKHNGASACEGRESIGSSIASREQHEQEEMFGKIERASCLSTDVAHANSTGLQEKRVEQQTARIAREGAKPKEKIMADSQGKGLEGFGGSTIGKEETQSESALHGENDCNSNSISGQQANTQAFPKHSELETWREHSGLYRPFESRDDWQEAVSTICRVTDGLPYQVDRLKSLGNAVVPQQVRKAWKILTGV